MAGRIKHMGRAAALGAGGGAGVGCAVGGDGNQLVDPSGLEVLFTGRTGQIGETTYLLDKSIAKSVSMYAALSATETVTYYAREIDGTEYYKAGAWPTAADYDGTGLGTLISAMTNNETVEIAGGDYSVGTNNISGHTGITIQGSAEEGYDDEVNINLTGSYFLLAGAITSNITLRNFTISGLTRALYISTNEHPGWNIIGINFKDCTNYPIYSTSGGALTGLTMALCTFEGTNAYAMILSAGASTGQVEYCTFYGNSSNPQFSFGAASVLDFNGCKFLGGLHFSTKDGTSTINNSLFRAFSDGETYIPLERQTARLTGTIILNNCWLDTCSEFFLIATDTSVITANNSIFIGAGIGNENDDIVDPSTTGTITLNNCYNNPYPLENQDEGTAATAVNCFSAENNDNMNIALESWPINDAYILMSLDDIEDHDDYANDVVDVWKEKGVKGTLFYNIGSTTEAGWTWDANFEALASSDLDDAREIAVHSWSHCDLTGDVAFEIQTQTGYTATLNITGTSFSLACSDPAGDVTFDLTSAEYFTMQVLIDTINNDYSTYYSITNYWENTNVKVQSTGMADVTDQAIESATTFEVDLDKYAPNYRFFRDEFEDTKAWLSEKFDIPLSEIISAAAPGSNVDQAQIDYLLAKEDDPNVGILINRGINFTGMNGDGRNLRNLNLLNTNLTKVIYAFGSGDTGARTQAEVTAHATAFAVFCKVSGFVGSVFTHSEDEELETNIGLTTEEWGWFIDAVHSVDPDMIVSFGEFAQIIRGGDWTRDETNTEVWNRVFDTTDDIALPGADSCLNVGGICPHSDGDGDKYDFSGYKIWDDTTDSPDYNALYGWSIGPYQYGHSTGNPATCYYHFNVVSGTSWTDFVSTAPLFSGLVDIDNGTLYTLGVANEIDATDRTAMTGDQFFFNSSYTGRGWGIYNADLTGANSTKADNYWKLA